MMIYVSACCKKETRFIERHTKKLSLRLSGLREFLLYVVFLIFEYDQKANQPNSFRKMSRMPSGATKRSRNRKALKP